MNRRHLAALLISCALLVAVIPIRNMLSNSPVDANSPPGYTPIMHIPSDVDKNHNGIADSPDQEIARATRAILISSVL